MTIFRVNDRVFLASKNELGRSPNNPKIGSEYECCGTVAEIGRRSALPIIVEWDNGTHNTYAARHLIKKEETTLNSIW
jgi:hypothetical protein